MESPTNHRGRPRRVVQLRTVRRRQRQLDVPSRVVSHLPRKVANAPSVADATRRVEGTGAGGRRGGVHGPNLVSRLLALQHRGQRKRHPFRHERLCIPRLCLVFGVGDEGRTRTIVAKVAHGRKGKWRRRVRAGATRRSARWCWLLQHQRPVFALFVAPGLVCNWNGRWSPVSRSWWSVWQSFGDAPRR
jgi:hypothetical protein